MVARFETRDIERCLSFSEFLNFADLLSAGEERDLAGRRCPAGRGGNGGSQCQALTARRGIRAAGDRGNHRDRFRIRNRQIDAGGFSLVRSIPLVQGLDQRFSALLRRVINGACSVAAELLRGNDLAVDPEFNFAGWLRTTRDLGHGDCDRHDIPNLRMK